MTLNDLGGIDSGHPRFSCSHENPASHRFCDVCGATRDRQCALCGSPNRAHARFCGACGVRLEADGVAAETVGASPTPSPSPDLVAPVTGHTTPPAVNERPSWRDTRDETQEREVSPWWERAKARSDDLGSPAGFELAGEDESMVEERRRRPLLLGLLLAGAVAAIGTIAIVLAIGHFSPTQQAGPLGHQRGQGPVAVTRSDPSPNPTRADGQSTSPPKEPMTEAPAPAVAQSLPEEKKAPPAARTPSVGRTASLPARGRTEPPVARGEEPGPETAPALTSPPQTSEERMADFLMEQLGPALAAEKALHNAAMYPANRSEHEYWRRVAGAIGRRGGRGAPHDGATERSPRSGATTEDRPSSSRP
jgi:Double zinc ribbon